MKQDEKGFYYLGYEEKEELQQELERVLMKYGLCEKVQWHPDYLEVPTEQGTRWTK